MKNSRIIKQINNGTYFYHLLFGIIVIFLSGFNVNLQAQNRFGTISGKVIDSNKESLIGVSIMIKGSTIGTVTDIDGNFTLSANAQHPTLVFSYIGYKTQEIKIDKLSSPLKITLKEDSKTLDEVVVVAYGTQSKVSVTGAISTVKTAELKQSPSPNLVSTLTGRMPGLTTIQGSGMPGEEDFSMYLRGVSTTNDQNPLILIDGVPRDNISMLDPNEIESVSVLKDASSTAVFGVRGANGVILITTKQGTQEKTSLSVTAEFGRQNPTCEIHQVDSWDFATLRNQARVNDNLERTYSDRQIELYHKGTNPLYPNTDWWKESMKSYAPQSRYNVNMSGGTDKVKYFVNVGMINQGGIFKTESKDVLGYDAQFKLNRYNFRTNINVKLNNWIKAGLNLAAYIDKQNKGGAKADDLFSSNRNNTTFIYASFYRTPSIIPVRVTDDMNSEYTGLALVTDDGPSPYVSLNNTGYTQKDKSNLNSSLSLDLDLGWITKGLSSKFLASFDTHAYTLTDAVRKGYSACYSVSEVTDADGNVTDVPEYRGDFNFDYRKLEWGKRSSFDYLVNLQWQMNYERDIDSKNHISGMLLMQRDNKEAASGSSDNLLPYNVVGFSGRLAFRHNNKYMAEFNAGYNGSEQFAPGNRFGFFPAGSIGWVISNESFFKSIKGISNLKLRASYGKVGNDKTGAARFLYLDNIKVSTGGFSSSIAGGQQATYTLVANPNVSWEVAYKQNYGIDLALFNNAIKFTADYFYELRENILISQNSRPDVLGMPSSMLPKANLGKIKNQGFEFELSYRKQLNKDFNYFVKANFNYNKNKVIDMDEVPLTDKERPYAYPYRTQGQSIGQPFGYLIDWKSEGHGYFTSEQEILDSNLKYEGRAPRPGDFRYKDVNGDGYIDKRDQVPIGYGRVPRITYAATFGFNYKGLDFNCLLQGVSKTSTYYSNWGISENATKMGSFFPLHLKAWTTERWQNGEEISYPALSTTASASQCQNDFFIMDRSYLRLKNIEIGYTLPKKIVNKIRMQNLRFYANGQNLLVWDKLPFDHFDPEQANASVIPINRVLNVGLNVTF